MKKNSRVQARGFSLVELMVALVVGLIVVGAVLALVVSIMKSNRQTLQSTRLNQELRATVAVIANDLRRARSVTDPLTSAKLGNPYNEVNTGTAECAIYAYDGAVNGPWHVIYRDTTSSRVVLATSATSTGATCTKVGTQFGSPQVAITALTFTPATATAATRKATRKFDVTVTGHLVDQDAELNSVSRTLTQSVYVRSIAGSN
jgi:prepilin-type N-terminal cleavage/methylation domain-containing protein